MIPYSYDEKSDKAIPWHTTFIGQRMQHNYWLYAVLDEVIINNPQIRSIVEIGTARAALTMFFGLWGIKRKMPVLSIDISVDGYNENQTILDTIKVECLITDENSEYAHHKILSTIDQKPTFLYCDGCCKQDEFEKYAQAIPSHSIIAVHDLGVEFFESNISADIRNIVDPYMEDLWNDYNIQLAIFKKK